MDLSREIVVMLSTQCPFLTTLSDIANCGVSGGGNYYLSAHYVGQCCILARNAMGTNLFALTLFFSIETHGGNFFLFEPF